MTPAERTEIITELKGIEAMAEVLKANSYRLRVKLSGVSTPDIPTGASEDEGLSVNELNNRQAKFRRRFKKSA